MKYKQFIENPNINIKDFIKKQLNERSDQFFTIIEDIEKMIRYSTEYKLWSMKHKLGINKCQICGIEFNKKLKPQVHHTPNTLFDIVMNVIIDKSEKNIELDTIDIVKEVIDLHINEEVSCITICPCCHKQAHYEKEMLGEEITIKKKLFEKENE